MHYIRFLKVPRTDSKTINALITITSDLGDDLLAEDVALAATLRADDFAGDIYLRKSLNWEAGMRALPVTFDISNCDLDWPIRLQIAPKSSPHSDLFERHQNQGDLPPVISVWSAALNLPAGITQAEKKVERRFTPLSNRTLSIWEETGESIARHIWDAGIGLAAFLDRTVANQLDSIPLLDHTLLSATYKKLNVLELGSGCGIVGISLAQSVPDCDVTLTDLPEAQEIAEKNIESMNPAMASRVQFEPLDWAKPLPPSIRHRIFDMIIVSDCTYNADSSPALVQTMKALVERSPKAIVVVAMKVRHSSERVFFDLMSDAGFLTGITTWQELPYDAHSVGARKIDIYIFHSKKRPLSGGTPSLVADPSIVSFWNN
ncbi:S-adenosyl-L-methionine-dependent methyltransferase [Saccharata proteae CBS 121410]|uniref:S-adenosyl-L-methionine-dependent methyltransferase n=1 Tax=Saccharata proteae CBS 121410 TaxID=1314787 RepID=A0A9P4LVL6_9PEZI|nr:S-adenosyl-L-methionine-dependent methyltransferase [Saccharata proteae CBS 121410]